MNKTIALKQEYPIIFTMFDIIADKTFDDMSKMRLLKDLMCDLDCEILADRLSLERGK